MRRDDARGSWRLAQDVITSWRNVIRIVTSHHDDHTDAYLKELSINKPASLRFDFYNVNDDHDTFFNSRIRFLL